MATTTTKFEVDPKPQRTFASQDKLPKLPVPPLEETCKRYLRALSALQSHHEHAETKRAVEEFLKGEGPRIQKKLQEYAADKDRYAELADCVMSCALMTCEVTSRSSGEFGACHRSEYDTDI